MDPRTGLLTALIAAAVFFDLRSYRIPNGLVAAGLVAGLGTATISGGLSGAVAAIAGAFVGLALFLPFYALRWLGAGDAKLLAMIGSFVGPASVCWVALYTLMAGGLLGVLMISLRDRSLPSVSGVLMIAWRAALSVRRPRARPAGAETPGAGPLPRVDGHRLPYAIALAAGTLIWALMTR
ncbi:MAG: prepilin peptidase [Burkholderiaceae bacterium]